MTRTSRILSVGASLLGIALTLSGCVSQTPIVERHFGEAALAARALQTVNPNAAAQPAAPVGIDGRAGKNALDRYYDSFKEAPQPSNILNIGVGGSN